MMLYGSWKYLTTRKNAFFGRNIKKNVIDLLVFYDPKMEEHFPIDCQMLHYFGNETHPNNIDTPKNDEQLRKLFSHTKYGKYREARKKQDVEEISFDSACWRVPQLAKSFEEADVISSFDNLLLYFRTGVKHILKDYSHIMHVNLNTLLSPSLMTMDFTDVDIKVGIAFNCNIGRKVEVSRLSKQVGIPEVTNPCATYSVLGRTGIVISLMKKVYQLGSCLPFENNSEDNDRQEALLIAKDVLLQSKEFSFEKMFILIDTTTCSSTININKVLTVSVADEVSCAFNKLVFFNKMTNLQTMTQKQKQHFRSFAAKDLTRNETLKMSVSSYAKFISYKFATILLSDLLK